VRSDWWPSTVTAARRIIIGAQRLEGSRFIACQLYQQAASGSPPGGFVGQTSPFGKYTVLDSGEVWPARRSLRESKTGRSLE
jgi:hypothetical protein